MPGKSDKLLDQFIKNNIELQKISTDIISSINDLNKKIDKMLSLFEEAAKNIEKGSIYEEPLAKKLESLLEQNKIIARGLILLEKYIRDKTSTGFSTSLSETKNKPFEF
jgi:hypothetical protein